MTFRGRLSLLLLKMKKSYLENLTVHGVSRIFCGSSWLERLLWFVSFNACFAYAIYNVKGYFDTYYEYEVTTEIRYQQVVNLNLPSIILCDQSTLMKRLKCFKGLNSNGKNCTGTELRKASTANFTTTFREGRHNGRVEPMKNHDVPGCAVFNAEGTAMHRGDGIAVTLNVASLNGSLLMYINNKSTGWEDVQIMGSEYKKVPKGQHALLLEHMNLKKLPSPYKNNCTNGEHFENFFTTYYTKPRCHETCLIVKMAQECGAISDHWAIHISKDLTQHYQKAPKYNDSKKRECIEQQVDSMLENVECDCNVPCDHTSFSEIAIKLQDDDSWEFDVRYRYKRKTQIIENVKYPWESMLSDIGGLVGLLAGASLLSAVEILVLLFSCSGTCCFKK